MGRGRLDAYTGTEPHPGATLRMSATTFARIAAGQQSAGSAAMLGQLQIEGDLALVARLGAALGQSPV
jgi:putative sterol carrier protein